MVLTDSPPRKNRAGFLESDRIKSVELPSNSALPDTAKRLERAMKADNIRDVRSACSEFLTIASDFYKVPNCGIRVLAAWRSLAKSIGLGRITGTSSRGCATFAPKSDNPDKQLTASSFDRSKAQPSVIPCPFAVCIAENRLEQCGNFIEKAAAFLTRQRGRERIGECVQPPAHSGW